MAAPIHSRAIVYARVLRSAPRPRLYSCRNQCESANFALFFKAVARPRYHHSRNLTARCDRLPNQRPVIVTWGAPRELVLGFTTTAPTSSRKGSMISALLMRRGNVSPRPSMLVR